MTALDKSLKLKRRGSKAKFTRLGNALDFLVQEGRSIDEISRAEKDYDEAYKDLQVKHEALTDIIEDDAVFDEEEKYMDECQKVFLRLQVKVKDHLQEVAAASDGQPGIPDVTGASPIETDSSLLDETRVRSEPSCFKMERPKLPKFNGDLREYHSFKSDFQHVVHRQYGGRDALMILRSCLVGKPLQNIQGLGQDYNAAWRQLDLLYGDPRMIADVIVNDISKIKALRNGEDERFCNFVNLVRRSFNSLNEIGRGNDMNNSHMLALIERKMCVDDRRMWFRSQQENTTPTLESLLQWLEVEMKARLRSSAPVRNDSRASGAVNQVSTTPQKTEYRCWVCKSNDGHWTDQCKKFTAKSQEERMQMVKDNYVCFSCLKKASKEHRLSTCKRKRRYTETVGGDQCKSFHHPLLHRPPKNNSYDVGFISGNECMLPVLTGEVIGKDVKKRCNLLMDSGAQISLVKQSLADELKLNGKNTTISITKVGGVAEELMTHVYKIPVKALGKKSKVYMVNAIGLPCINDDIEKVEIDRLVKLFDLKKKDVHRGSGPVDLLIGIDHNKLHGGEIREMGRYSARCSPLGWVIYGSSPQSVTSSKVFHIQLTKPVNMSSFWSTEEMGVKGANCECKPSMMTKVDIDEYNIINQSCKKEGKQWIIPYPWKKDPEDLPDNRFQAEKMLQGIEKRLLKNPEHSKAYQAQMTEMVEMGFARKLTEKEMTEYKGPVHYISHHEVVRPDKKSTPIPIVFNSSSKYHGHCLNDYWYKGPDLLNSLLGVLMRFREHQVALSADISKMYHRVRTPEMDQHVHRYLWRDLEIKRRPDVYIKTVLTFGDRPASAMAQIALRRTAEEAESMYPQATQVLKENTYMDDICVSVPSEDEARKLFREIDVVLEQGGFKVKGWTSNQPLEDNDDNNTSKDEMNLLKTLSEEKVLGVAWNQEDDLFTYKVNLQGKRDTDDKNLTKRKVLSKIARIFDPIGFAAAFLVRAKIGLQRLWQLGLDWDDVLPEDELTKWISFFKEMEKLSDAKYGRCLTAPSAVGRPILCIFSDASENAFGVCAYLRWLISNEEYEVKFVTAKSRVAPLKKLTVPRLELQAAVMASRMYETIKNEMTLQFEKAVLMTDSRIVLAWIQSQGRQYKPFVSSRIGEIQSHSDPAQWKHIPGDMNPADDVSRGVTVEELSDRWLHGPEFLRSPENEWPVTETEAVEDVELEKRKVHQVSVSRSQEVIDCKRFSSWRRLIRVTSYVMRFVEKLKAARQSRLDGQARPEREILRTCQLQKAENYWLQEAQKTIRDRIDRGDFKVLSPFVDKEGLIRVGGRLDKSQMSYERKHPVLLPHSHWISMLITRFMHQHGHGGVATTAAKTRRMYWILQVHKLAKTVKYRCVVCREANHQVESQFMADLPKERTESCTPPFYRTSCDYFGPYKVKMTRNTTSKYYGVIFTCLNTRAVHLELAVDASTMEFLQVLRRFFSIRGQPASILSDNGTQFVGAERELREMVRGWSADELKEFCAERGTEWKFSTPSAPHHNGCAEALVKSCKLALNKAIGDQLVTPFELYTCLQEVGNLINQRPIGRVPTDPDDGTYLCPNDILLGRASTVVPQGPFKETRNPRHRFEFVQRIVGAFWKSWIRDVFPLLVPRRKWNCERRNVKIDDVVILADPNAVRGRWNLGRVVEVFPGSDGKVRTVKVKSKGSEYRRPISKIVVIYPAEGYGDD